MFLLCSHSPFVGLEINLKQHRNASLSSPISFQKPFWWRHPLRYIQPFCLCAQMVSRWRERRALPPRCSAMRCAACAATRPLASITTCWVVRAARASSDAASSKVPSTPARTMATARWTCTCAANASSAGYASAERRACSSSVSLCACVWEGEGGEPWNIKTCK